MNKQQPAFRIALATLLILALAALIYALSRYLSVFRGSELVWFAPNMGSTDYPELFTEPGQWPVARSKVDVFEFYANNVLDDPCSICGSNTLSAFVNAQAFQKLTAWNIAIGVEVNAVKEWGCTGVEEFAHTQRAIQSIQANGGTVSYLAMDEPLLGGQHEIDGVSCRNTLEQSATATAWFVEQVKANYPHIVVGDIEPYPRFSISELEQWITTLKTKGVTPAFFHLDVDMEKVKVDGENVTADLQALKQFCQANGIPFGVIFTSNWTASGSDDTYYASTLGWVHTVTDAIGRPEQVIFQSWQGPASDGVHKVPVNLPENDPAIYSHTRLLIEGLAVLGK